MPKSLPKHLRQNTKASEKCFHLDTGQSAQRHSSDCKSLYTEGR